MVAALDGLRRRRRHAVVVPDDGPGKQPHHSRCRPRLWGNNRTYSHQSFPTRDSAWWNHTRVSPIRLRPRPERPSTAHTPSTGPLTLPSTVDGRSHWAAGGHDDDVGPAVAVCFAHRLSAGALGASCRQSTGRLRRRRVVVVDRDAGPGKEHHVRARAHPSRQWTGEGTAHSAATRARIGEGTSRFARQPVTVGKQPYV